MARKRQPRNLAAGILQPEIDSFRLHLNAEGKSPKTVSTYVEAAQWFAAAYVLTETDHQDWSSVQPHDVQRWIVHLLDHFSQSYANNQYRALQQYFKWWSEEEDLPSPMARMKPPKVDEKVVEVFTPAELTRLLKHAEGRTYVERRDHAILSLFVATGMRLSELAGLRYYADDPDRSDIDLLRREALVRGKGGKARVVRFGHDAARSLDRYLRMRAKHTHAHSPKMWLGINNRPPMTANGIYQMIARRGEQCGAAVHPHKFRHHFSHTWLDNGGAEGDLMELNGWSSPQMLRRYGASARGARARRSYDRIMTEFGQ